MGVRWPAQQHTVWTEQAAEKLVGKRVIVQVEQPGRGNGLLFPATVNEAVVTEDGALDLTLDIAGDIDLPIGGGGVHFLLPDSAGFVPSEDQPREPTPTELREAAEWRRQNFPGIRDDSD